MATRSRRGGSTVAPRTALLVQRTKRYLEAELANPVRLGDIGRAVGASPGYLTAVFRRVEGCSLHQYLIRLRLARARGRLHDADDLTALALDVGFSSHSHFSAAFRRIYGCSPSALRRIARQRPVHDARAAS